MKNKINYTFITISNNRYRYHDTGIEFTATNDEDNGFIVEQRMGFTWIIISKLKDLNDVKTLLKILDFENTSVFPFNIKKPFSSLFNKIFRRI